MPESESGRTLDQLAAHLGDLYQRHNRLRSGDLLDLATWILVEGWALERGVRRHDDQLIRKTLANTVGWTLGLVNHFNNSFAGRSIAFWMASKYPRLGCAYCGQLPCVCPPDWRPPAKIKSPDDEVQLSWSLRQWQTHLTVCYGEVNRSKGIGNTLARLFAEIGEVVVFIKLLPVVEKPINELERELALEIADIIAWAVTVAHLLDIDLETAVIERYHRCPECNELPCSCGHLALERSAYLSHQPNPRTVQGS